MGTRFNIIGFSIDDKKLEATFRHWADAGKGAYFIAKNAAGLAGATHLATRSDFEVMDGSGRVSRSTWRTGAGHARQLLCAPQGPIREGAADHSQVQGNVTRSTVRALMRSFVATLVGILSGCGAVGDGDAARSLPEVVSSLPRNRAGLVLYLDEASKASVRAIVRLDGVVLTAETSRNALYKEVLPGKHTLRSSNAYDDSVIVETRAGTVTYLWLEVRRGIMGQSITRLVLLSDEDGKARTALGTVTTIDASGSER